MHKAGLIRDLEEAIGKQSYSQFFRETDSQTRTHDRSVLVKGICHCTKARPLHRKNYIEY